MLESDIEQSTYTSDGYAKRRIANVISVLLPAREYRLECSWTTEKPLPAVEEFACKLMLVMDAVSPSELRGYFGLSTLEADGLVRSLVRNRLVEVADDGMLHASAILQAKGNSIGDIPTLTTFETREENAVFDLLALQIVPRRSYGNARFGLPEIPIPDSSKSVSVDRIAEAFSEQYRAYLEFTRGRAKDSHKTRLYKVSRCRPHRTVQVPIDMEVSVEAGAQGELRVFRDAVERLGENRRRPLSNELESRVADYLAHETLQTCTPSVEEFCSLVGDEVLARYVRNGELDLGRWLADRNARKTGYGDQSTRALLGPVYLTGNRTALVRLLKQNEEEVEGSAIAHWLPANVPFWAANSSELVEFMPKVQRALGQDEFGRVVACFCGKDAADQKWLKKKYHGRIPHAVSFMGGAALDRVELFVVPNRLVVAQYHLQPSTSSAVTLPIGFVSTDAERVSRVTNLLAIRLSAEPHPKILWSDDFQSVDSLIDFSRLGLAKRQRADSPTAMVRSTSSDTSPSRQVGTDVAGRLGAGKATISEGKIVWKRPKED
ncbi:hypothetical protein VDG37_15890 [Xanthomonas campestris pv. raphani]|uniref:hypothetical protein n=1 Tax=Xanthomonas campestris TaxID=339 RepID=UPI002B230D44|nr:hypothetical protein [Xanthomonas campestris]MEA9798435.1 hypothetical protein [Xanthomonas campestris pv. raphani]MEA9833411.1 hypothetical protein [Xanthomonas campestris pv. raphani]MEA9947325.1 hypothetical protein [Xanthomonas campestris pv. raphani]MEA9954182.1 hypothetical protein [Xanthomonas campestris pv. raphani]